MKFLLCFSFIQQKCIVEYNSLPGRDGFSSEGTHGPCHQEADSPMGKENI